jgi:hypothetical protein
VSAATGRSRVVPLAVAAVDELTVTPFAGILAGAVYRPAAVILPFVVVPYIGIKNRPPRE